MIEWYITKADRSHVNLSAKSIQSPLYPPSNRFKHPLEHPSNTPWNTLKSSSNTLCSIPHTPYRAAALRGLAWARPGPPPFSLRRPLSTLPKRITGGERAHTVRKAHD
jgi:hypothetical protein